MNDINKKDMKSEIESIKEEAKNKSKKPLNKNNKWIKRASIIGVLVLLMGCSLVVYKMSSGFNSKSETVWTEEQLYEEKEIDYSILDKSVIESDNELSKWYEDNVEKEGIYSMNKEDFTYLLVSGGLQKETGYAIQLYDIREGEKELYVGYNILTPEDTQLDNDVKVPHMLVRTEITVKQIEGKVIKEPLEKLTEADATKNSQSINEESSVEKE